MAEKSSHKDKDKSKVHKLSLKGSSKLVSEFVSRRILACSHPPQSHHIIACTHAKTP
jgi:hypothetical protein